MMGQKKEKKRCLNSLFFLQHLCFFLATYHGFARVRRTSLTELNLVDVFLIGGDGIGGDRIRSPIAILIQSPPLLRSES